MNDQTPDTFDTDLAESLQTRWPERKTQDRQVNTLLATLETQNRKTNMQTRISNILRPLAFVGGLALLVLALSWIFGSMRPNPATEITPTPTVFSTLEGGDLPTENTDPNATSTPTPAGEVAPTPTSTPLTVDLPTSGYSSLPQVSFAFANPLPTSPAQIILYQQHPEGELTEDTVRQVAQQMGLNGEVTSYPGEGGDIIYNVTDGDLQMIFYGFPDQFTYAPTILAAPTLADPLPFDQRVAIAEEFLNAHNLLNYSYRAEPSETDPNGVRFVELLDGIPLLYGIGSNPGMIERINISINPAGQISSLFHSTHNYQPLGDFPLLTAEQAWERLSAPNSGLRTRYAILTPPMSWTRAGAEPAEVITGYLSNENGDTTFYADDGRSFPLLDIPADMPLYPSLQIKGTVTAEGLDWSAMTLVNYSYGMTLDCGGGGGSGIAIANFGGGNFAIVTLDPSAVLAPNAYISPIQPGDPIDGVQGILYAMRHIRTDGSETTEYSFWYPGDETNSGWTATLEGDAIAGTESLQNLPIQVWGTVTSIGGNGQPIVAVDRYEEAYPGTRLQAWLGTQQILTLEGQEIVLLTTTDGSQFVIDHSLEWGAEGALVGLVGDTVVIEGYLIPDNTFGGYPVLNELSGSIENSRTNLSDYILQSNRLGVQDDANSYVDPGLTLTGTVTIENVELMYSAATLTRCRPEVANNPEYAFSLYAQPVWRFTGHFDDGRLFEVQVQALPDDYLR